MYPLSTHVHMAFMPYVCEKWRFVHLMNDDQNVNTGTDQPVAPADDQATPAPAEGDAPVAETPVEEKPATEETPAA